MKRFRFRLDVLLDIRIRREEKVKLELAEKNKEILKEQDKLNQLHEELKKLQSEELQRRKEQDSIILMNTSVAYRFKLKKDMLGVGGKIDEIQEAIYHIRKKLISATKDRKAVEILKERQKSEWLKKYRTQEQSFIDDISQKNHIRSKHAS
ncbi:MAG TPA: flagellar export protein FliJ [Chitinispirillaceae bacterium]|nr:flagellar export protein FliJ [Chitinispirillaceae bacterium]